MTISLVDALATRENAIRLRFDADVYFTSVLDPGDASDPRRYTLQPIDGTVGSDGEPPRLVWPAKPEQVDARTVLLWTDRKLSPYPSRYRVALNGILEAGTLAGLVVSSAEFYGLAAAERAPSPDNAISNADIANPQTFDGAVNSGLPPTEGVLGTFPVDTTGDIAKEEGLASYKKRVIRRVSTQKGRYKHAPEYGIRLIENLKHLARPGLLAALEADAENQIKQEPETVAVKVRVAMQGGVAYFRIRARCSFSSSVEIVTPLVFINP